VLIIGKKEQKKRDWFMSYRAKVQHSTSCKAKTQNPTAQKQNHKHTNSTLPPPPPPTHLSISCPSTTLKELSWPSGVRSNRPCAQAPLSSWAGSWASMCDARDATVSSTLPWLELPLDMRGCRRWWRVYHRVHECQYVRYVKTS